SSFTLLPFPTLFRSIVQPIFGALGDRWHMRWLIPVSIFIAGVGIAVLGLSGSYWLTATVAAISGMGVAAYHPAGASRARQISGTDHVLMSWFSLGGNIGFAIAPLLVFATVGRLGLSATPLLLAPALTGVIAVAFVGRHHTPTQTTTVGKYKVANRDDWRGFARMSVAIICRSIVFVGIGSFIVLFM